MLGAAWMVGALRGAGGRAGRRPARVRRRSSARRPGPSSRACSAPASRSRTCAATSWASRSTTRPLAGFAWDYENADRRRPAGAAASRHRLAPACSCATPGTCAACRRPRCCRPCCPRDAAGSTASARSIRHVVPAGLGARGPGCGWSRWTTTPGSGCRSAAPGVPEVDLADGGDGVVRDPRLVPAGPDRRPTATSTAARGRPPTSTCWPVSVWTRSSSSRPRSASRATRPSQLSTRLERQWRARVTRPGRCARCDKVHRHGTEVTVLGPGAGRPRGHRWQPDGRRPPQAGARDVAAHLRGCPATTPRR